MFNYSDIAIDRVTGRIGTFIEFCAPPGTDSLGPDFALVEFGGEAGTPNTGDHLELIHRTNLGNACSRSHHPSILAKIDAMGIGVD